MRFVDTAGMRRKSRIDEGTEYFSMVRALQAVDAADVALLVIDATEGVTHQDQRLAERVDAAGCPIVVLLNKWELLDAEERERRAATRWASSCTSSATPPVLQISALTGKGVHQLLPALDDAHRRLPPPRPHPAGQRGHPARPSRPSPRPHGGRILYATQGATDPPTFTLFTNKTMPPSYLRYLERQLREAFDLGATPIKLRVRRRAN